MKVCSVCGLSFSQIQKNKVFGCPECFYTFEEEIKIAYNNLNISEKYSGSLPKRLKGYKSNLVGRVETQSYGLNLKKDITLIKILKPQKALDNVKLMLYR